MIDKYLHFLLIRSKNFQYWFDTTCVLVNKHKINILKCIYFQNSFSHNLKLTKLDDATDFQANIRYQLKQGQLWLKLQPNCVNWKSWKTLFLKINGLYEVFIFFTYVLRCGPFRIFFCVCVRADSVLWLFRLCTSNAISCFWSVRCYMVY